MPRNSSLCLRFDHSEPGLALPRGPRRLLGGLGFTLLDSFERVRFGGGDQAVQVIDVSLADIAGATALLAPNELVRLKPCDAPLHRAWLDAHGRGDGLFGRMGLG